MDGLDGGKNNEENIYSVLVMVCFMVCVDLCNVFQVGISNMLETNQKWLHLETKGDQNGWSRIYQCDMP